MEVGRWWTDGVQNSVGFYVFKQLRTRDRRGRLKRLIEQPNNQAPHRIPHVPVPQTADSAGQNGELDSLYATHRVGRKLEGGGRMAYRIVPVFMSSI